MFRRRKLPDDPLAQVDPAATSARFSAVVAEALDARRRYGELLAGLRPGPVRDQLAGTAKRLDAGVLAVWDTACRATEIERTLSALDPERVTGEYKRARRAGGDTELESALGQRFASVQRLLNTLDDTDDRLRLLDARMGAVVAQAAEIALGAGGSAGVSALDAELDGVVDELGALRAALGELG
jgi:hypothetical protein